MTDCFAVLLEPRRPWIDQDALKRHYLQVSTQHHPDRFHSAQPHEKAEADRRYAELNTAYQCLSDTRDRLRHLLELERGKPIKDVQRLPPGTFDLFTRVGQVCRDADAFLASRATVTSPMLKVSLFQQAMRWTEKLNDLQGAVTRQRDELEAEIQALNAAWETAPPAGDASRAAALPLDRLEEVCRSLSYTSRWAEQIQERLVQLAF
jgi:curved DNA-binding protein CbpA